MPKYNISYPIAGTLNFYDIESENKAGALKKCRTLVREYLDCGGNDILWRFDGEWDMYENIYEGCISTIPGIEEVANE